MRSSGSSDDAVRDQKRLIDAAWGQARGVQTTQAAPGESTEGRLLAALRAWQGKPPKLLPGYQIVEEVHRGGQGVVYRAKQESTGRDVAIKVMREGPFAGPRERVRFEREVQILARLKHRNIVTIHDSGVAGHVAYFVMDYIAGAPLDEYVEKQRIPLKSRLQLFEKICAAVEVAHLNGIIHRDLKPGNIRIDADGEPHVLDFGLAKYSEWHEPDSDVDAMTQTGQFIGSLPWASPEQAQGQSHEIDVRTDVYSLGVVLFQLITGSFPYDVSGSLAETANNIVSRLPIDPRSLNSRVDDEVRTIVLKALRKERELRYQTAGAFGRDTSRYLRGEPIEAKRDSLRYVLRKQLARHRVGVGVGAAFLTLIVVGFAVSLAFWQQAAAARDAEAELKHQAIQDAERASAEAAKAAAVTNFLTEMLESANPVSGDGADVTVQEVIDAAVRKLERGELANRPALEGSIRRVIGGTYAALGLYDRAAPQLAAALDRFEKHTPDDVLARLDCAMQLADCDRVQGKLEDAEQLFQNTLEEARQQSEQPISLIASCLNGLAGIARDREQNESAETLSRESLELLRKQKSPDPQELASTLNDLALALSSLGKLDDAIFAQEEALELFIQAHGREHFHTAVGLSNLAGYLVSAGKYDAAEENYAEALAVFRKLGGDIHPNVASCLDALGRLYLKRREFQKAEPLLREALEIREQLFGDDHVSIGYSLNNLAIAQYNLGDYAAAAAAYDRALAIFRKQYGDDYAGLGSLMNNLAAIQRQRGNYSAAIDLLRDALELTRRHRGEKHPLVATCQDSLGNVLSDAGELEEAESVLRSALELRRELHTGDHVDTAQTAAGLAEVLRQREKLDEAEALCREALEMRRRLFGSEHITVAQSLNDLGLIRSDQGSDEDAEPLFAEAVAIAEQKLPADHWLTAGMRRNWGGALFHLGRDEAAEEQLSAAYEVLTAQLGPENPQTQRAIAFLVELYEKRGDAASAADWRAKRTAGSAAPASQPTAAP